MTNSSSPNSRNENLGLIRNWGEIGETKDSSYLAFAQKVSDFAIEHPNMPEDGVPYWDFGAPGEDVTFTETNGGRRTWCVRPEPEREISCLNGDNMR